MSEHWQQVKQLFQQALSLSEDARQEMLRRLAANDPALHKEIVELLGSHEDADQESFLSQLKFDKHSEADFVETISLANAPTANEATAGAVSINTISTMAEIRDVDYIGQIGDYRLVEQIGRGGMGVVYKAYQEKLRRTVALKVIATGSLCAPEDIARFHIEAESAARLNHPGIVPVYDVGEHDGKHYYSMAYVEGESLAGYVGEDKPRLDARRAALLMEQVCRAMQFAHDHAVIHRDIKPANIMVDKDGQPKVTDFGLAKVMQDEEGLTMTGQVMGTPNYMAPEQAKGQLDQISNRTDVYSLGATLYALLAGVPPFRGKNIVDTLRKVETAAPQPLSYRGSAIGLDLWTICEKCLAKRPQDRYESAGALAEDLHRYLAGFPISARAVSNWTRGWRWCQRNPLVAGLLATVATTLLVASIVSTILLFQKSEALSQKSEALSQKSEALVRADLNLELLENALDESFISLSESDLADEPGTQQVRRKLLSVAQKYYDRLGKTEQVSPDKMARAAYLLGRVQASLALNDDARGSFERALQLQQSVLQGGTKPAEALESLSNTHNEIAKLAEREWSVRLFDEQTDQARNQLNTWLDHSQQCLKHRREAAAESPANPRLKRLIANAEMTLGLAYIEQGKLDPTSKGFSQAEALLQQALASFRKFSQAAPDDEQARIDLARGLAAVARLRDFQADGDKQKHDQLLAEALGLRKEAAETLASLPPDAVTPETQILLATCHDICGENYCRLNQLDEAEASYQQNVEISRQLLLTNPAVFKYREASARAQFMLSQFYLATRRGEGYQHLTEAKYILADGLAIDPNNQKGADLLMEYTLHVSQALAETGLYPEALHQLTESITILQETPVWKGTRGVLDETIARLEAEAEKIRAEAGEGSSI